MFLQGVWGRPPENFWVQGSQIVHSSAIQARFTIPSKNFSSDLHSSQKWSWKLGKSLKSD